MKSVTHIIPTHINVCMIVSDNTIQAEGLGDFFRKLGKSSVKGGKELAEIVISNPGRALDLTTKYPQQQLLKILNRLYQQYQN